MDGNTVPLLMAPRTLAAGEAFLLVAYGGITISFVVAAGATLSYSKVDSPRATAHDTDTKVDITASADISVAWPWYYVSVATAGARVCVV